MRRFYLLIVLLITALVAAPILAQDTPGLEFGGTVTVIDDTTIQVGGLTVDISGLTDIVFEDGMFVTVSGNLQGTQVVAISVVIETPDAEATEVPEAEVTPEAEATEAPDAEVTPEPEEPDDADITIVIEGPVESIEANVVRIYSFEIELAQNDPRIAYIQIGDRLHIRGHHHHAHGTIVIVALVFNFVDVDVLVFGNQVWRDTLTCDLFPPAWADTLAIHWHSRCDVIIIAPSVPSGCKVTGMGGIKCSGRR